MRVIFQKKYITIFPLCLRASVAEFSRKIIYSRGAGRDAAKYLLTLSGLSPMISGCMNDGDPCRSPWRRGDCTIIERTMTCFNPFPE